MAVETLEAETIALDDAASCSAEKEDISGRQGSRGSLEGSRGGSGDER
jgi:hypothetical protein